MSEIDRIARLLEQTFEGRPYHGPSVLGALEDVTADVAARRPPWSARRTRSRRTRSHGIWEIVAHLTAELTYARQVIEGTAGPWDSALTWPDVTDTSEAAWREAIQDLKAANQALVRAVKKLDDTVLDQKPIRVRGPFYTMLHGTIHHNVHHAGQISLLRRQISLSPMEATTIRLADMPDREALCRLYHAFHQFHVRGVPDRLLSLGEPPDTYQGSELYLALEKIIGGDDAAIWLAQVGQRPVGLAEVYVRQDEPNPLKAPCKYGYLQSLMVDEAFRRRGIGTQLLEAAQRWAKEKGAVEMRLETWEFESGPLPFYARNGYHTLRRMLVREL